MNFEFIEADIFTKQIQIILTEDEYSKLQVHLIRKPDAGVLIPGGAGLRKLRWGFGKKGKSGGARIIYYWYSKESVIYFVYAFKKSNKADLSAMQLKMLARYIKGQQL